MAKQKYRLQPVLDVRDKAKQAAARLVATRREQLAAAEAKLEHIKKTLANCRALQVAAQKKMLEESQSGIEARKLVTHRTHLADLRLREDELKAKVEEQRRIVANAEAEVDRAIAALIEASREVQVIEKHRESWRERSRR